MKIVFFEAEDLEEKIFKKKFPEAVFTTEKLNINNVSSYKDADIISCRIYSFFDKKVIDALPNLKLISCRSTGFDNVDLNYCKEKNISVVNVPSYGSITVAEYTFALLLDLTRHIDRSADLWRQGKFDQGQIKGVDLYEKTIGIVGLGRIGIHVMKIALGFGMKVLAFDFFENQDLIKNYDFKYVDLQTLIKNSDVISLHLPLTDQTRYIINKKNIFDFKKLSYLINTGRGGLIDTEAIMLGLNEGILSGVGLDVLEEENDFKNEPERNSKISVLNKQLMNHPQVIITPHNAFNSHEALIRKIDTTADIIDDFINEKKINNLAV